MHTRHSRAEALRAQQQHINRAHSIVAAAGPALLWHFKRKLQQWHPGVPNSLEVKSCLSYYVHHCMLSSSKAKAIGEMVETKQQPSPALLSNTMVPIVTLKMAVRKSRYSYPPSFRSQASRNLW